MKVFKFLYQSFNRVLKFHWEPNREDSKFYCDETCWETEPMFLWKDPNQFQQGHMLFELVEMPHIVEFISSPRWIK